MKKTLATLAIATIATMTASAQVQLAWDVSGHGTPADATLGASTINPDLSLGGGLNTLSRTTVAAAGAANSFNSTNWNITGTRADATNYIGFSLATTSGPITLSDLQYAINGSNTAPGTGQWGYSLNGGAFVLQTPFTLLNTAPVSLSTWDFSDFNLNNGDTLEFRFWAFGTTSISGGTSATGGSVRIANVAGNDLVLNSAVPEPTTLALIGVGLAGVAAFARRGRKA